MSFGRPDGKNLQILDLQSLTSLLLANILLSNMLEHQ